MLYKAMNTKGNVDRNTLLSINNSRIQAAVSAQNIESINRNTGSGNTSPGPAPVPNSPTHSPVSGIPAPAAAIPTPPPIQKQIPPLINPVRKGQKTALSPGRPVNAVRACFGWNTSNPQCEVDVSAFLLKENGKVPGDTWFVFYGQPSSPDGSVVFHAEAKNDREEISIRFQNLNPEVKKIVFVLTINEAFEKHLHFGMMKDAYIRILDSGNGTELTSFQMTDYYSNVISMMIGEIYLHNGTWKFNAIGNGAAKDLAGLCALYGVEVTD